MSDSRRERLPEKGLAREAIERHLAGIELEEPYAHLARAFRGPADVQEIGRIAFDRFLSDNGFFSLYMPYMQVIEQAVVDMGVSLLHPEDDSGGNFTSGGTKRATFRRCTRPGNRPGSKSPE